MIQATRTRLHSKLIIALVVIQALFLIGFAVSYYAVGWYGKEIRLQTVPVDPRDLTYGDYVRLKYDINEIDKSLWKGPGHSYDPAKILYVVLAPDPASKNGTYKAAGIYEKKPSAQGDEVVLKGQFDYTSDNAIHVKYGLETYYVPQNTGKELEEKANKGSLVSHVKVASWGRAVLERIE